MYVMFFLLLLLLCFFVVVVTVVVFPLLFYLLERLWVRIVGLVCITNESCILIRNIYFSILLFSTGSWNCPYFLNGCVFLVLFLFVCFSSVRNECSFLWRRKSANTFSALVLHL